MFQTTDEVVQVDSSNVKAKKDKQNKEIRVGDRAGKVISIDDENENLSSIRKLVKFKKPNLAKFKK